MDKVVLKLITDFVNDYNLDRKEVWMGNTSGFSAELKEKAIALAHKLGFEKVNWMIAGGVITTHGGPDAFCVAGFVN